MHRVTWKRVATAKIPCTIFDAPFRSWSETRRSGVGDSCSAHEEYLSLYLFSFEYLFLEKRHWTQRRKGALSVLHLFGRPRLEILMKRFIGRIAFHPSNERRRRWGWGKAGLVKDSRSRSVAAKMDGKRASVENACVMAVKYRIWRNLPRRVWSVEDYT